jgi:catechol 2,3-dioxygenase-like lactoylglutathione lyase family enzyme
MLTRIDHVMICVPDLQQSIDTYTRLGFNVSPGGVHPGQGTHNAIAFHEEDYLELLSVRDRDEYLAGHPGGGLLEFLAQGGGFRYIAVQSDNLVADVAQMRQRGVDVSDPSEGARQTPTGQVLRWKAATLGPRHPLPIFFIEHLTPLSERRQAAQAGTHPNGVLRADRVYIAVADVAAAAQTYSHVLGMPAPKIQHGAVIKADMAVFDLGPTGLTVAQPAGPFQVLYRTRSMDAAARWMADQGVSPPVRGIRNTGEQAMLVHPDDACGAYIGFVEPA